jgi:hypothetical protein
MRSIHIDIVPFLTLPEEDFFFWEFRGIKERVISIQENWQKMRVPAESFPCSPRTDAGFFVVDDCERTILTLATAIICTTREIEDRCFHASLGPLPRETITCYFCDGKEPRVMPSIEAHAMLVHDIVEDMALLHRLSAPPVWDFLADDTPGDRAA